MSAKQPDLDLTAPGPHLPPSPTVHSDKEDSLFCSFVAFKIILSKGRSPGEKRDYVGKVTKRGV